MVLLALLALQRARARKVLPRSERGSRGWARRKQRKPALVARETNTAKDGPCVHGAEHLAAFSPRSAPERVGPKSLRGLLRGMSRRRAAPGGAPRSERAENGPNGQHAGVVVLHPEAARCAARVVGAERAEWAPSPSAAVQVAARPRPGLAQAVESSRQVEPPGRAARVPMWPVITDAPSGRATPRQGWPRPSRPCPSTIASSSGRTGVH